MSPDEVENSNIKKQINTQLTQIANCPGECKKIASGLIQHKSD